MTVFTKEKLQQIAESDHVQCGDAAAMARLLLAGMNQQPIAWLNDAYLARGVVDGEAGSDDAGPGYIPVYREPTYTAPPAPLVLDAIRQSAISALMRHPTSYFGVATAQQVADMIQGAAGNYPVIPEGWIPFSERPPESMPGSCEYIVFETLNNRAHHDYWNVPDKGDDEFTPFWNHYDGYVTHWMPLPAAPKIDKQ